MYNGPPSVTYPLSLGPQPYLQGHGERSNVRIDPISHRIDPARLSPKFTYLNAKFCNPPSA